MPDDEFDPEQRAALHASLDRALDEPTDLPDGAEVEVVVLDDELSAEERAALHASLDRALEDSEANRGVDAMEYLRQYRARRANRPAR